ASPLCDTFPAISYFGYIFSLSGILAIPTLIGVITLLSYFGTIFLYNRRNPNDIWKYSGWMKLLAVLLVLFSASLSLIAALAAMVHIVGTTIYNIFKNETPRQYDRWLIVLLILVLIFQLPRLLLLVQ